MDRNRKILIAILAVLTLSAVLAIVKISMNMQGTATGPGSIAKPQIGPGVGIVHINGMIRFDEDGGGLGMSQGGAEAVIKRLNELEQSSNIKAIVVRINSPGGTVAATQEIYQKLWKLRKKNKILVASLGEMAASGGYYAASACNHIMANHGTLTGSIGVIAMSPNLKKLFEKLGIEMRVIKSGRYKDLLSMYRELSPEERAIIQEIIDSSYQKFVKDVADGRGVSEEDIEPYADGRVFGGATALKCKLVDSLGTFEDAIDKAREMAKLPADCPVYEQDKSTFQQFLTGIGSMFRGNPLGAIEREATEFPSTYRLEYRYR